MSALVAGLAAVLALVAGPVLAEDPVLDDTSRSELVAALAAATAAQQVCYGYDLTVSDESGAFSGRWEASNLGDGVTAAGAAGCTGYVVLHAAIDYTSESSEAEDSASWSVDSSVGPITAEHLARLGLKADQLLDDDKAEMTLVNAVLALPVLTADAGFAAPIVLDPVAEPAPADARSTGRPSSDWWRENGTTLLVLLGLLALSGLWAGSTTQTGHRSAWALWRAMRN